MGRTKKAPLRITALFGWLLALALTVFAVRYLVDIGGRDLSLQLSVNGEPLCRVSDRTVVDDALILLNERLEKSGINDRLNYEITYRYVLSDGSEPADAAGCMELLYDLSCGDYVRAYRLSIQGMEIAACATYAEAEQIAADLERYIAERVKEADRQVDLVELTSEFEIRSVFCRQSSVSSVDDIYRALLRDTAPEESGDGTGSETRISAIGAQAYRNRARQTVLGQFRGETAAEDAETLFSFPISGLNAAIAYHTVSYETYSEILPFRVEYHETEELYVGLTEIVAEGETGLAENCYEISYADGEEIGRRLVSSRVITEPKDQIERKGTKEYPSTEPTGTFIWPLQQRFMITCYYGVSRVGKVSATSIHYGIDLAGPELGSPVYAADGGEVIFAEKHGSYGNIVKILHEDNVQTYYAHMDKILVNVGDRVYPGQQIGEIGRTGLATGVHLHFEVRIDGQTVDPLDYLPPMPY